MSEPKKRRRYTSELEQNAVKLATRQKRSVAQVAGDLGVSVQSLHRWVAEAKRGTEGGLSFEEREELARLRRETWNLRMDRDILKNLRFYGPGAAKPG